MSEIYQMIKDKIRMTEEEADTLLFFASGVEDNGVILEIGTLYGGSAVMIWAGVNDASLITTETGQKVVKNVETNTRIFTIDDYKKASYEKNKKQLEKWGCSDIFLLDKKDGNNKFLFPIDLLFIDGDHEYESVKKDIQDYVPKVKHGGLIIFHDYGSWDGVTRAVKETNLSFVRQVGSLLITKIIKRSLVIGRFQPPHLGHQTLVETLLKEGRHVLIAVRDTEISINNPYSYEERKSALEIMFNAWKNRVEIMKILDIDEVVYGRKVGWGIRELRFDKEIEDISATKIRENDKTM